MGKVGTNVWLPLLRTSSCSNSNVNKQHTVEPQSIGILTFEVASLMSKSVQLWHLLADDQMAHLKNQTLRLKGIRKLVSDNDNFLLSLAYAEIEDSFNSLSYSIVGLGIRCTNHILQQLDDVFHHLIKGGPDHYGLEYAGKKMERKVRKMERFVTISTTLYDEIEVLRKLEGTKRATCQSKLALQKQEVERLQETSLWVRSYDYTVRLLARSLITILARMNLVFSRDNDQCRLPRTLSTSDHPGEAIPLLRLCSISITESTQTSKTKWPGPMRHLVGCVAGGSEAEHGHISPLNRSKHGFEHKWKIMTAPPSTLGGVGLALHYANVIIFIQKLVKSPHLISRDERDDLYDMLTANIKAGLWKRLGGGEKEVDSGVCGVRAEEFGVAVERTVKWLTPLARNMVSWQSERNFEQRQRIPGGSVMLVQTLYFADQLKTEAAITELLVGLNYLWRFRKEGMPVSV